MTVPIDAYPLTWPPTWRRTPRRERSRFDTSFADARYGVLRELQLLGARDVIISSNVPLRRDGLPYANQRQPDDPAIAVYFTLNGEPRCIPSDKWDRTQDNLRAIELTIGALRGLERWGAKEIMTAAFQGFQALPSGTGGTSWWQELGVAPTATADEIEAAYRNLAKRHHPDRGGDAEMFHRITTAYTQAKGQTR